MVRQNIIRQSMTIRTQYLYVIILPRLLFNTLNTITNKELKKIYFDLKHMRSYMYSKCIMWYGFDNQNIEH